jgi:hypothetical protein
MKRLKKIIVSIEDIHIKYQFDVDDDKHGGGGGSRTPVRKVTAKASTIIKGQIMMIMKNSPNIAVMFEPAPHRSAGRGKARKGSKPKFLAKTPPLFPESPL